MQPLPSKRCGPVDESMLDLLFCLQPRDDNLFLLCSHNRRSPVFDHPTSFPLSDSLRLIPREAETPHGRAQRDGFDGEVVGGAHQTRSPKGKTVTHQRILKSCFIHLHHIPSDGRESSITHKTNQRLSLPVSCSLFASAFCSRAWGVRTLVWAFFLWLSMPAF